MRAHLRYLSYVMRHKWFVLLAGLKTGAPLWRLLIHDWSKFLPAEWSAYVRYFYGTPAAGWCTVCHSRMRAVGDQGACTEPNCVAFDEAKHSVSYIKPDAWQAAFDRAWLHHQHGNPHHWQHWLLREDSGAVKTLPMPDHFVREMVADWMGAGRAITGRWEAGEWYEKNRLTIQLETYTRFRVEKLLTSHAGLKPIWGCVCTSPTYCRDFLGGCEAHCSAFSRADLVALGSTHPRAKAEAS